MIERYTIKAAPALSHKELMKQLDTIEPAELEQLYKLKVKIEIICDAKDLKKISDSLKEHSK